jgi:hypothetical protein
VSGWSTCPSCQFLVTPGAPRCPFCGADLARGIPAAAPVPSAAHGASLPPPPPPPPGALAYHQTPPSPAGPTGWFANASPEAPASPFAEPPRDGRARRYLTIGAACVAVLVVCALGANLLTGSKDDPYPDAWDPEIAPLAAFVEGERGMLFKHPVSVEFLDKAAFDEEATSGPGPTDEERADLDRYAGMLRAFGLVTGEVDLFDTQNEIMADGVAAYYDPTTKRITVNGDQITAATKVTLVHELTHALQDQYFDLQSIEIDLDDETGSTYLGVVEGDATRIENAYFYDEMTDAERQEYFDSFDEPSEVEQVDDVQRAFMASFQVSYSLGEPLVTIIAELRGQKGVDDAIRTPPSSTELLLDPLAYLEGDERVTVTTPELREGEEHFDEGTLGAFFLYLVLNERLDPKEALAIADGWGGDAYVAFTRDGTTCVRADLVADSPDELARFDAGLAAWAAAMPAGTATHALAGDTITIETCDPGSAASLAAPVTPDLDPLLVPTVRAQITQSIVEDDFSAEQARCVGGHFWASLRLEQILAEDDRFGAEIAAQRDAALAACP